jgi:uncharacterized membrane protein
MRFMRKTIIAALVIIIISFAIGLYLYPQMPDKLASHWNADGEVDGYSSKFIGLFLMPIISLLMLSLFFIIPFIDPYKHNIKKFRNHFDTFILIIFVFFFYIYILTLFWNFGYVFNMVLFLIPAFALLFFYAGVLIENSKRNFFIGIRTPWTLANEKVWNNTHKLGGKLYKISSLISFLGLFFQKYAFLLLIAPLIFVSIFAVVFSYFDFQKQTKKK